jgi:hypothetical protein
VGFTIGESLELFGSSLRQHAEVCKSKTELNMLFSIHTPTAAVALARE